MTKPSWDDRKHAPTNKETADHSFYYCTAIGLVAGECTSEHFGERWLRDPRVARIAERCTLEAAPELTALFKQGARPAAVEVRTRRGTFRREVRYPKGDPRNPMTWDDVERKFMQQAAPVLGEVQARRIAEHTRSVEQESDVRAFAALLGGASVR